MQKNKPIAKPTQPAARDYYPHSVEAEINVIGTCMKYAEAVDIASSIISPDDFMDEANQIIYKAIQKRAGKPMSGLILSNELSKVKHSSGVTALEFIGGEAYIGKIFTNTDPGGHIKFYSEMVRNLSIRRQILKACREGEQIAIDGGTSENNENDVEHAKHIVSEVEQRLWSIGETLDSKKETIHSQDLMQHLNEIIHKRVSGTAATGLDSGYKKITEQTGGLRNGEVTIIAGRTSMGKTALALNMLANIAKNGHSVLLASLEMSRDEIAERLITAVSKVRYDRIRNGTLDHEDQDKILIHSADIGMWNFRIDDSAGRSVVEIASTARRMKRKEGLAAIFIDYLQLIRPSDYKQPRQEQVAKISRDLKHMARELKTPVVCLAQLNRETAKRKDGTPTLADLRESGAIEQDADVVIFVHRPAYYDGKLIDKQHGEEAKLIIGKNRNGPTGESTIIWHGATQRYIDPEPENNKFESGSYFSPRHAEFDEYNEGLQ